MNSSLFSTLIPTLMLGLSFFAVRQPNSCTGLGLFQCLEGAMDYVGIADWKDRLVGFGCDSATNMDLGGLKGRLQEAVPWTIMVWRLAHMLELSLNYSLKNTYFASIDDMLPRLYYSYENSTRMKSVEEEVWSIIGHSKKTQGMLRFIIFFLGGGGETSFCSASM